MQIIVASTNPVKIKAVELGFAQMFPDEDFKVEGVSAPSGVSDQPIGEEETLAGANNRVENVSRSRPDVDFWIGIEGGVKSVRDEMEAFAWVVVKSRKGGRGKARSGSFFLPKRIVELVKDGKELGEADDIVFGKVNSKQANGTVGNLTGDAVTRTKYYEHAVILALVAFKNSDLY